MNSLKQKIGAVGFINVGFRPMKKYIDFGDISTISVLNLRHLLREPVLQITLPHYGANATSDLNRLI
jgi:hypothetical protein